MQVLKVAANTKSVDLAKAISTCVHKEGAVEVRTIGTGALNQAVKAISIAQKFLKKGEYICTPKFIDVDVIQKGKKAFSLVIQQKEEEQS